MSKEPVARTATLVGMLNLSRGHGNQSTTWQHVAKGLVGMLNLSRGHGNSTPVLVKAAFICWNA